MLDASNGGALLSYSYEDGYKLIESITSNTYQRLVTRVGVRQTPKKLVGVYEVSESNALGAQVAQIHQMMKNMMNAPEVAKLEPIKVVTDATTVSCVYCGGVHLF